ncbi:aminodeoxychorismate/anthranilate synthase component II [Cyanobacterium stanieri LEGE 03274]|uniref:Aminodeoxychorismate/anthranilate synthase component II n=1 Tax=Cyanobacterium stanieri LEGE 03274 TaxID=1828756 RepID=A0ABR9V6W8_9CHRO|nr:aminodeoxychorismate/anthranilate synthase component II [Cyanobacterium stanieri]MBE9223634.1 aminodeoxychorismate/anthranilate synthase component II [Cyanobacterium stanieri LEGE 03274]
MILVIDNYDSFTYNLVQYLGELSAEFTIAQDVVVYRNDQITLTQLQELKPDAIVISPGPGNPQSAGICLELVQKMGQDYPILGVCLGHQTIGEAYGGKIIPAPSLMHGKTSPILHNNQGVFKDISSPFQATRYHSLIVDKSSIPSVLEITAWTEDDIIMGIRHKQYPWIEGVQFHPESILTDSGLQLLRNFLKSIAKYD